MKRSTAARTAGPQAGFTLLEVLVSLGLLSLLVGALFAASASLHRSWDATRERDAAGNADAAALMVSDWLAQAVGVLELGPEGVLQGTFKGRRDGLDFVTLGQGHVPAGLVRISIGMNSRPEKKDLIATWSLVRTEVASSTGRSAELMNSVVSISFRYLGRDTPNGEPSWRDTWLDRNDLPLLVSLEIIGSGVNERASLVTAVRLAY